MTIADIQGPPRDLVGYEGNPPKVVWPGGARIAISLVVNYEEGSELSIGDGDAWEPIGIDELQRGHQHERARALIERPGAVAEERSGAGLDTHRPVRVAAARGALKAAE